MLGAGWGWDGSSRSFYDAVYFLLCLYPMNIWHDIDIPLSILFIGFYNGSVLISFNKNSIRIYMFAKD